MNKIIELKNKYYGQTFYIVGKGPSLSRLKAEHLHACPIIAINQAITKIEEINPLSDTIFSMQKDGCNECKDDELFCETCKIRPKKATLLVHKPESGLLYLDYAPRYVFDNEKDFGIDKYSFSSVSALFIALMLGAAELVFVSHDAAVSGDTEEYIPNSKTTSNRDCYIAQGLILKMLLMKINVRHSWLIP